MKSSSTRWEGAAWCAAVVAPALMVAVVASMESSIWALSAGGLTLFATLGVSTFTDLRERRIPNWLTYPAAGWAVVYCLAGWICWQSDRPEWTARIGMPTPQGAAAGFGVGFGLILVVYLASGFGAGDVKLMGVVGLYVGFPRILEALIWSYALASAFAVAGTVIRRGVRTTLGGLAKAMVGGELKEEERRAVRAPIPMAPFYLFGTAVETWRHVP